MTATGGVEGRTRRQIRESLQAGSARGGTDDAAPLPTEYEHRDTAMVDAVRRAVLAGEVVPTDAAFARAIGSSGKLLGSEGVLTALDHVRAELEGLGPLEHLLADDSVTDILVNGPEDVWIDGAAGLRRVGRMFDSDGEVRALAVRLVAAGGRRLDDGCPAVDVQLNEFRVHAVLPPISTGGTLLSIRIRRRRVFTLEELIGAGAVAPVMARALTLMMRSRLNFLISGATGTGKTTLLSTLLGLASARERVVLVEDSAELAPAHPHTVGLQARHGNLEGAGVLDLTELVRQALRMRPDRLVVGECRGAEVRELLAAMNTGHDGGGGTIHANSAEDVPARLSALAALAGLAPEALALQAASALDVVVHVERDARGRHVASLSLLRLDRTTGLVVIPVLVDAVDAVDAADGADGAGGSRRCEGWTQFAHRVGWSGPEPGVMEGATPARRSP